MDNLLGGGVVDSRERRLRLGDHAVLGPLGMCADLVFVHCRQELLHLRNNAPRTCE